MAGGLSFLFGAAPKIQPGNTYPFRVCCGIDEKLGQTPDRIDTTIRVSKELLKHFVSGKAHICSLLPMVCPVFPVADLSHRS
jgi:hypothetical protein